MVILIKLWNAAIALNVLRNKRRKISRIEGGIKKKQGGVSEQRKRCPQSNCVLVLNEGLR